MEDEIIKRLLEAIRHWSDKGFLVEEGWVSDEFAISIFLKNPKQYERYLVKRMVVFCGITFRVKDDLKSYFELVPNVRITKIGSHTDLIDFKYGDKEYSRFIDPIDAGKKLYLGMH